MSANEDGSPYASLAMYPFDALRPAWGKLWAGVIARVPWAPGSLRWSGSVQDHWTDPSCTVAHACGWPIATQLHDRAVVGAFGLRLPDADGHRYRSVLVSRDDGGRRLAPSSEDSLSGWISALATLEVDPEQVTFTGSHEASLVAIASGDADMAMVDALTLAHLRRLRPELTTHLVELGRGPWIPSPAIIVPAEMSEAQIGELGDALTSALADDATIGEVLLLDGFVPLDRDDYLVVLDLVAPRS